MSAPHAGPRPHADSGAELRARKQTREDVPRPPATSTNGSGRRPLRLVHDATQTDGPPERRHAEVPPVGGHMDGVRSAVAAHTVTATHPPTLVDAAANLWLDEEDVRHGLAGQLGAALVGLIQLAGLAICWGAAHGLFATKTRTAITTLALAVAIAAYAIGSHI